MKHRSLKIVIYFLHFAFFVLVLICMYAVFVHTPMLSVAVTEKACVWKVCVFVCGGDGSR